MGNDRDLIWWRISEPYLICAVISATVYTFVLDSARCAYQIWWALYSRKRALYSSKRALYSRKRAQFLAHVMCSSFTTSAVVTYYIWYMQRQISDMALPHGSRYGYVQQLYHIWCGNMALYGFTTYGYQWISRYLISISDICRCTYQI